MERPPVRNGRWLSPFAFALCVASLVLVAMVVSKRRDIARALHGCRLRAPSQPRADRGVIVVAQDRLNIRGGLFGVGVSLEIVQVRTPGAAAERGIVERAVIADMDDFDVLLEMPRAALPRLEDAIREDVPMRCYLRGAGAK